MIATQTAEPSAGPQFGLTLMALGAVAGVLYSYRAFPDAKVCRIPELIGGCGGQTTIQDTDGNSRPKRPCWGHPDGKPKRLVNLLVVLAELALGVVAVAVLVSIVKAAP